VTGSHTKKFIHRKSDLTLEIDTECDSSLKLSPLLTRIFQNRNISHSSDLHYPLSGLESPDSLKGGNDAAAIILDVLENGKNILIVGDYDTDGATGTALGVLCLRAFGAYSVNYLVPNRFDYGYGLSEGIAQVALDSNPDLVITVDNGISSVGGVDVLNSAGVKVIITDHHLPGSELPEAEVIVNPNQQGCDFPSKSVSGVGVMFYLLMLVRARLKEAGWFERRNIPVPNLAKYLDLVALGTVADMVPLDRNNRILVSQGISRIRSGKCRLGLVALLEVAGRHYRNVVSQDLGFIIAPRLNAAGRLQDISTGIECLISECAEEAKNYAGMLESINSERKKIESKMQGEAMEIVSGLLLNRNIDGADRHHRDYGFCLYDRGWHQGITGLVASRVKDRTEEPVITFAITESGTLSGSARSVSGLHIRDLLEKIASESTGLITKFGGHAMAAGLTINEQDFDKFKQKFHAEVNTFFRAENDGSTVYIDGCLSEDEITLDNAIDIKFAAPWGQGFPVPLFEGEFYVMECTVVGQQHLRMKLKSTGMQRVIQGIAFRAITPGSEVPDFSKVHIVYQMDVNEFRGKQSLQFIIEHLEAI